MEKQIKIAAKLYECRDTAKRLFKEEYEERVKPYSTLIIAVSEANKIDTLQSMIKISQLEIMENNGMGLMMLMAAAVEIIEPSKSN
jgi:hypothetical protein